MIDEFANTLNKPDGHACYCARSVDNGCECAIKDAFVKEFKVRLLEAIKAAKPKPTKYEKYNSDCLEGFENGVSDYEKELLKLFGLER